MKDMTERDILLRQDRPLTSLSVYRNGVWIFAAPTNLTKTYNQQQFYLMSESFGLVREGNTNPRVSARRGAPGEYLAVSQDGSYTIVTRAEYDWIFPTPNLNPPEIPNNSKQLKDPNFLTKILKGYESGVSNSKTSKPTPPTTGY